MIQIIYENADFIAINKPAGMLVHRARQKIDGEGKDLPEKQTVVDWVLKNCPEIRGVGDNPEERPGIVHRLDKDTSGVLMVAKNQGAFLWLKTLFQKGQIKKRYKALVWGELLGRGVVDKPIGLISGSVKRGVYTKRSRNMKMVKSAVTEYESLGVFFANRVPSKALAMEQNGPVSGGEKNIEKFSLLNLFPKTGRTHQIRVHLQSIHHPVVGDSLYGPRKNPFGLSRFFLHAEAVEFFWGKDGEILRIEADMPDDLQGVLNGLSKITKIS